MDPKRTLYQTQMLQGGRRSSQMLYEAFPAVFEQPHPEGSTVDDILEVLI